MVAAIKQTVVVQPGGLVQVQSPRLHEGDRAEVIVLVEEQSASGAGSAPVSKWSDFIGSAGGQFKTIEEVDAYIRELRDEWEH